VVEFNAEYERSLCDVYVQECKDEKWAYYITYITLTNDSPAIMKDVSVFLTVSPWSGYAQLVRVLPARGYRMLSFERGTVDSAGFTVGNTGTYRLSQLYSYETSKVGLATRLPLMAVRLRIDATGFSNSWTAECDNKDLCEKGQNVNAKLIQ
jgi:hypothetical protein